MAKLINITPETNLLLQLLSSQEQLHGDCGHFVVLLSCKLIECCLDYPIGICRVYMYRIHDILIELLSVESLFRQATRLNDKETLTNLVKTVISAKHALGLDTEEINHISKCILDSFLSSINISGNSVSCNVEIRCVGGCIVQESRVLKNQLILDVVIAPEVAEFINNTLSCGSIKVLLFDISLRFEENQIGFNIKTSTDLNSNWTMRDIEIEELTALGDRLVAQGVQMILSQRVIHPWLRNYLLSKYVLPLERLSVLHIAQVQSMTNCLILSHISKGEETLWDGYIGELASVKLVQFAYRKMVVLEGSSSAHRTSTLILANLDEHSLSEMETISKRAIKVLTQFISNPFVVAGGGAVEWFLANSLRNISDPNAKFRSMCASVAEAFEFLIIKSAGFEALQQLNEHNSKLNECNSKFGFGWDCHTQCVSQGTLVDSGPAKLHALSVAIHAAVALSRVRSVVQSS